MRPDTHRDQEGAAVDPAAFGDTWAAVYDEVFAHLEGDAAEVTRFIADRFPARGALLELGVGTGRLAIPLAAAGFAVTGVDASARMLEALAAKPGGDAVAGVLGDMVAPPVRGAFDVILIAFNTLFSLPDQDAQVACVRSCADVLAPSGELLVETAVPEPWRFRGEVTAGDVRDDQVAFEMADHDPVGQVVRSARVLVSDTVGVRALPLRMRYAWPAEVDLMARLAGLRPTGAWGGWSGEPFDADARRRVASYAAGGPR